MGERKKLMKSNLGASFVYIWFKFGDHSLNGLKTLYGVATTTTEYAANPITSRTNSVDWLGCKTFKAKI